MAALEEERCYGLSCGRVSGGGNVSVFHVKLTDSALRAFESYQHCRSLSVQPSIRFAGNQGKICVPRLESPSDQQAFTFYLSNVGKDNPQGSFDCIRQYVCGQSGVRLHCVGPIHDKITVCASDDSYQKARQSMTQAEEETRSRAAIVIKAGGRYPGKKVHIRKPPAPCPSDIAPCRQVSRPVIISSAMKKSNGVAASVQTRPLRERLTHLLALKPYSRPELVLRLQKDGLSPQDRHSLETLLQQVADLNSRDNSFTLKDSLFKEVQMDWPGYSEGDQQLLKRLLVRKLCLSQNAAPTPGDDPSSSPKGTANTSLSQSPPQKRLALTDFIDPLANKKPRISHLARKIASSFNNKLRTNREASVVQSGGPTGPCPPPPDSKRPFDPLCDVSNDSGRSRRDREVRATGTVERLSQPIFGTAPTSEPLPVRGSAPLPPSQPGLAGAPLEPSPAPVALHAKSKKKSKKNKDKDKCKDREKKVVAEEGAGPGRGCDLMESRSHGGTGQNGTCHSSSALSSTPEKADYLLKYTPICSHEQRQSYKNDFNVEYSEYRGLHARIEAVTRQFTVLDSQLRKLQPGTDKYKTIHNQILQEYRKIKKTNANYTEEKNRCEYLHSKLAHIKKLIAEYDQQQLQGWY